MANQVEHNQAYWNRRKKSEEAWINKNIANDDAFNKKLGDYYNRAMDNIQVQIESEYHKYAKYSQQSLQGAMQAVSGEDVESYAREAKQIVEEAQKLYEKSGKVLSYSDFSQEVNDRLKLYNATMRINRLEYLKSKMGLELTQAGINVKADLANKLTTDYLAERKRQAGILKESLQIDNLNDVTKIVMSKAGNDYNFSDRLWLNQDVLKSKLDNLLNSSMIQGQNPVVIARQLRDQVKTAVQTQRYITERIARTESARVQTQAQLQSFKQYGYDYVQWINEPTACQICVDIGSGGIGGQGVYKTVDVPDIPVHPNCRCSIAAWYDPAAQNSTD